MIDADDLTACRALLRRGSKSFGLAARLLPREVADSATALYAFCRVADDLIDDAPDAGARGAALDQLRRRLDGAYDSHPHQHAADRALSALIETRGLPRAPLDAMLEGFAWDADGRRYRTLDDLEAYGMRVAGTVGMMLCVLMGERRPEQLARACDLGIAMQLTNIVRDVAEDARLGRLYLPLDWLEQAGIDPEVWLGDPHDDARLSAVLGALLARADVLYRRADLGIEALPRRCRWGIRAARGVYADIGRELALNGCRAMAGRAVVPVGRKVWLLLRAATRRTSGAAQPPVRVHPAVAALVAQVAMPDDRRGPPASSWIRVAELFIRLDRRTRLTTGSERRHAAAFGKAAGFEPTGG